MIAYRTARHDEIDLMLDWAAKEGWNPGLDDADAFFDADPAGFFVATSDESPIGAISVVNHTPDFAFLGLYLMAPEFRGKGIGYGLWQHAIVHAGSRTIGLDGVPDQQANYQRSGFSHSGSTTRFGGTLTGQRSERLRAVAPDDVPTLVQLEAEASGCTKDAFLTGWFQGETTRTSWVCVEDQQIVGFVTVRQCRDGAKIGPLVAPSAGMARTLVLHAAATYPGEVFIDLPDSAVGLRAVCEDLGLDAGFATARMYRGPFRSPAPHYYAISSMELG